MIIIWHLNFFITVQKKTKVSNQFTKFSNLKGKGSYRRYTTFRRFLIRLIFIKTALPISGLPLAKNHLQKKKYES